MRSGRRALLISAALSIVACLLTGSDEGACLPELLEVVCVDDRDCATDQMCNTLGECDEARVTVDTDGVWYAPGAPVLFTVDTHGLSIEVPQGDGVTPWSIERWDTELRAWAPLHTTPPQGCRTTGCIGGQPILLCAGDESARCVEHHRPFEGVWDGHHWVATEVSCGDATIRVDERVVAPAGSYVVRYRFAQNRSGSGPYGGLCWHPEHDAIRPFGIY